MIVFFVVFLVYNIQRKYAFIFVEFVLSNDLFDYQLFIRPQSSIRVNAILSHLGHQSNLNGTKKGQQKKFRKMYHDNVVEYIVNDMYVNVNSVYIWVNE